MGYVETARLTPTGLGEEGDLLLAASRSLQALALPVHCWLASDIESGAWSTRPWWPRAVPPFGADIGSMPVRTWLAHIWMFGAALSIGSAGSPARFRRVMTLRHLGLVIFPAPSLGARDPLHGDGCGGDVRASSR